MNDYCISDYNHSGRKQFDLVSFTWDVINVCNYNCSYCGAGYGYDNTRPKSTFFKDSREHQIYKSVLLKLKSKNVKSKFMVNLVGGEPTLHPNLFDIIKGLEQNDNCVEISLITNLSKNIDYFDRLNDQCFKKLIISPSIHFEYYKSSTLTKCLHINSQCKTPLNPLVMLHNDPVYWDSMQQFLDMCVDNNIKYHANFIENIPNKKTSYGDDFYKRFGKYFEQDKDQQTFLFSTSENTDTISKENIYKYKLNRFKNWSCRALGWTITYSGSIIHTCTKKTFGTQSKSLDSIITCPLDKCGCDIHWEYDKHR